MADAGAARPAARSDGSEVTIRRAGAGDLADVAALLADLDQLQRTWRVFPPRSTAQRDVLATYREAIDDGHPALFVAEADGAVVGMAFAHEHAPSRLSDERALEVSSVIVRPSHRSRGIGRRLVAAAVGVARDRGLRLITLQTFSPNEEALGFWDRLGLAPRKVELVGAVDELAARLRADAEGPPPG